MQAQKCAQTLKQPMWERETVTGVKAVISEKEDGSAPIAEATVKNGLNGTIIWKVPEAYNGNTYYLVVLPADSALEDVNMEDNAS